LACYTGYITTDDSVVSKSGQYFTDLSGCTISLLEDLIKEDHADYTATFNYLMKSAWRNLRIDVQRKLADRFHIDKKLITRETSEFKADANITTGRAGIKISVRLPKYARLQILSIGLFSEDVSPVPAGTFYIQKDDEDGELLATISGQLAAGRNLIEVYQDFEEETLFISYDADNLTLRQTKTKYYADNNCIEEDYCDFPCVLGEGSVRHINGGGLNVKFVLYCSMDKFICDNLPLFQGALFYRLGVDTMKERISTQKINKTTVLTAERAVELLGIFNEDYQAALDSATANIKIKEDPICFMCKATIQSKNNLP
jgi:hypothetical protein